jgi:hypothetical protein
VRKHIDEEILDHEVKVDQFKILKKAKTSVFMNLEEEKKGDNIEMIKP